MGDGVFTRVVPPPSRVPESFLGDVPLIDSRARFDEMASQSVFDEMVRLDCDPSVAAEIARIDRNATYVVVAIVRGGSGRAGQTDDERRSTPDEHRIVMVGQGSSLHGSFMHLVDPNGAGSDLIDVEVYECDPGERDVAFPLWSGQTVKTSTGKVIKGTGSRAKWEAQRPEKKTGRPKKSGGGMTATERRQAKANERARASRARKNAKKRRDLEKTDPVAAARMRRRSDQAKKAARKRVKPGKGRTR